MVGALEYFAQEGTQKWIVCGCARIFWSSRHAEMDWLWVRKNNFTKKVCGNCWIEGAPEYFIRVGTRKLLNRGCARIFWSSGYAEMDWSWVGLRGTLKHKNEEMVSNMCTNPLPLPWATESKRHSKCCNGTAHLKMSRYQDVMKRREWR
jgi:hypothetical protein